MHSQNNTFVYSNRILEIGYAENETTPHIDDAWHAAAETITTARLVNNFQTYRRALFAPLRQTSKQKTREMARKYLHERVLGNSIKCRMCSMLFWPAEPIRHSE